MFLRLLKNDLSRVFSLLFVFSVVFIFITIYLCYPYQEIGISSTQIFFDCINQNDFKYLFFSVAIIPSLKSYSQDLATKNIYYSFVRCSKDKYIFSKLISNYLSAVLVILIPLLSVRLYLYSNPNIVDENSMYVLHSLKVNDFNQFVNITTVSYSLSAGFFSILCLMIANMCNNVFLITATPFVLPQIISGLAYFLGISEQYSFSNIINGIGFYDNYSANIVIICVYMMVLTLIISLVYYMQTKRR